jgi:hypothetical protein
VVEQGPKSTRTVNPDWARERRCGGGGKTHHQREGRGERTQGTFIVFGPSSVQSWFAGNKAPVHTNSVDREGQGGAIRLARRILRRGGNGRASSARARVVRVSGGRGGGRSFVVQTGNPRATRNFLEDRWAEKLGNPRWATKGPSTRPPVVRGGGGKVGSRDCAVQGSLGKPAGPWPGAGAGAHLGPWLKLLDPSGRRFCWLYRGCYSSLGGLVLVAVTSGVPFLFGLLSLSPELMTW